MKSLRFKIISFAAIVLLCIATAMGQEQATDQTVPPAPPPKPQFFGGTVTELDEQHVKVARTLAGRPTESRSFMIGTKTKINRGAVKMKSRVTVRYQKLPEGDVALEIQLRPTVSSQKS